MKIFLKILVITFVALMLSSCTFEGDLTKVLFNLQRHLTPLWSFLIALCWVLGTCFMATGILKLKAFGQQTVMMATHASLAPSVAYLLVGAGLIYVPHLLDTIFVSLWNYGTDNIKGYSTGEFGAFEELMGPIVQIIQVIGLIAFIRGWILLLRLGSQGSPPGTLSKGLLHMFGGILAINILGTLDLIKGTFGV